MGLVMFSIFPGQPPNLIPASYANITKNISQGAVGDANEALIPFLNCSK